MNNQDKTKDELSVNIPELSFSDIFNLADVQRLQDLFADAHGVASIIADTEGKPITKPSNFTRLCKNIIRKTDKGCENCYKSNAVIGRNNPAGAIIHTCLSCGLWHAGASINVEGKYIANWLIGQVRNEQLDEQQMMQYADEIGANKEDFKAALNEVPIMSSVQFQKIANLLFVFANELSEKAYSNMQLCRQIAEKEKAITNLQEREENLSITLHSIGDGVISTDINGLIVNMNPVAERLCGWQLAEASMKPLNEVFIIVNAETHLAVADPVQRVLQHGEIVALANHTMLISKNGTEYQISDSAAPIKNKEGEITGVVLVFSDISDKYAAQIQIKESEERYRSLILNLDAGIVVHAPDTSIVMNNSRASELLGLSNNQIKGKTSVDPAWEFVDEMKIPLSLDDYPVNRIASTKKPIKDQVLGLRQPGKNDIVWVTVNGFPMLNALGDITEIVISFIDVSKRKIAENKLVVSEKKLVEAQHIAHMGNWELNIEFNELFWSDEIFRIFDCRPNEFEATYEAFIGFIHPDDKEMVNTAYLKSLETKKEYQIEHRVITKNNQVKFVREKCVTIFNEQGKPLSSFGIVIDITEQKQIELELAESTERFKALHNASFGGIAIHDKGKILECNQGLSDMTGYSFDELFNMDGLSLIAPEHRELVRNSILTGYEKPYEADGLRKNGERFPMRLEARNIPYKGKNVRTVEFRDITESKKAEMQLIAAKENVEESKERYRSLLDNLGAGIVVHAPDTSIALNNPKASELLGLSEAQMNGKTAIDEAWKFVNEHNSTLTLDKYPVNRIVNSKKPIKNQILGIHQPGKSDITWVTVNGFPKLDNEGNITEIVISIIDVSEKKRAEIEIRNLNETLEKRIAERTRQLETINKELTFHLSELEQFSYVSNHDLQEPLRSLVQFSQLIKDNYSGMLDEDGNKYIDFITKAALRMKELVKNLLEYSLLGKESEISTINCNTILKAALIDLDVSIKKSKARIVVQELPTLNGYETELRLLFQNLIANAIKYQKTGNIPELIISAESHNNDWLFKISDNGIGIDEKYRDKIFIIFQRLHNRNEYEGTGIGLAHCKKIVELHGGKIWVESILDKGSTFIFTIPKT